MAPPPHVPPRAARPIHSHAGYYWCQIEINSTEYPQSLLPSLRGHLTSNPGQPDCMSNRLFFKSLIPAICAVSFQISSGVLSAMHMCVHVCVHTIMRKCVCVCMGAHVCTITVSSLLQFHTQLPTQSPSPSRLVIIMW